jgi:ribose-phosphate pyrophosphokinase
MEKVKLIAGRSNPTLAKKIAGYIDVKLVDCQIINFANGEIYVEINENIRGSTVYFIQTGANSYDGTRSINDHYVEALQVADACRRSDVASIGIIYATFPYSRSDKKNKPRVSIMSSVIANGLKNAGYSRIICMDIHAGQTQGVVDLPFDNLYAIKLQLQYLNSYVFGSLSQEDRENKFILVSPDVGGSKRIKDFASRTCIPYAIMDKQRDYTKPGVVSSSVLIGGDIKGKTAIVVDDMADSMGTMISAVNDLKIHGAKDVIVVVTHGILSPPAIDRINTCDMISEVIVTDTIDQSVNLSLCHKLKVVETYTLFGQVIRCLTYGTSISSLFE